MRSGVSGIQPERLIQARESLGMTRIALSSIAGVSPATVTNWESGKQLPEQEKLVALSVALNVSQHWFLRKVPELGGGPYFFRSKASATKGARSIAKIRLNWVTEIAQTLEEWLDWPQVSVPRLGGESFLRLTDEDIEVMASRCRDALG